LQGKRGKREQTIALQNGILARLPKLSNIKNLCSTVSYEGEQNSDALCSTLLQPMAKRMEKNPLNLDAPEGRKGWVRPLTCFTASPSPTYTVNGMKLVFFFFAFFATTLRTLQLNSLFF